MPKEVRVDLAAGQTARIFAPNKMTGGINKSGTSATIKVGGTYVEPVPPDTTKPVIGNIQVLNITKTGATIKWVPSEKSTGQVAYGLTIGLGSLTTKELAYLPSHTQNITGLQAGKTYYFEIMAEDEAGNLGVSDILNFDTLPDVVTPPPPTNSPPITVTTNGAVIDGLIFSGTYGTGSAITVKADNVTIRNCNIKLFRQGIEAQKCKNLIIESNTITDCDYAGVLSTTQIGGRISKNTIQRIGAARTDLSTSAQNNAYGIAVSNYSGDAPSSDVLVEANIVEDVPLWHGLDTHNGVRITFKDNIVRRTPRALFVTKSTTSPTDCVVTGNQFLEAITKTGGTNKQAVTLNGVKGITFLNNKSSVTYGKPMIQDYTGGGESSTGIVETGTVYVDEPVIPPANEKVVSVTNITDLRKYLADNTVDRIICEDGRYISNGGTGAGSLWIGSQTSGGTPFMERTRPVIVQARNKHKAIIEGGYLSFEDGAHHQTWDGFRHSNMSVSSNGVINFGGYFARRSPHHITIKNLWIDETCKAASGPNASQDHAIYPAHALGDGPNNIIVEDFRIDCVNLNGALHSWHPEPGQDGSPPRDIIFRRGIITKPWWGIVGGHITPVTGYLFEDIRIEDARRSAIAWDLVNPNDMTFRRVVTVRSKLVFEHKWSAKPLPPGIPGFIIEDCSFA